MNLEEALSNSVSKRGGSLSVLSGDLERPKLSLQVRPRNCKLMTGHRLHKQTLCLLPSSNSIGEIVSKCWF